MLLRLAVVPNPKLRPEPLCYRRFGGGTQRLTSQSRPSLPFLHSPSSSVNVRRFASTQKKWVMHEIKLAARYTGIIWGVVFCGLVIFFAVSMELDERAYPTPHELGYFTRGALRMSLYERPRTEKNWVLTLSAAESALQRLEDPSIDGQGLVRMIERHDPQWRLPFQLSVYNITARSEEWRRIYFDLLMLVAENSQSVEGWLWDKTQRIFSPPEFVAGPSNPHPVPLPPGTTKRPREEDCVLAFPSTEEWYIKILGTKGFTERQKIEAALAYANWLSVVGRPDGVEPLHQLALAEAARAEGLSKFPFDEKTFVLKRKAMPASANFLAILTDIALHKVRDQKDAAGALPILLSVLQSRKLGSDEPLTPVASPTPGSTRSAFGKLPSFFSPPDYPAPPPDGTQPPWRSSEARCQEACLRMYIGEILFALSSREDGVAWTRDAVDTSEGELRKFDGDSSESTGRSVCRQCLKTSLDNWAKMVAMLAREEESKKGEIATSRVFSFWNGPQQAYGRWRAEQEVVASRVKKTEELAEVIKQPENGIWKYFKA